MRSPREQAESGAGFGTLLCVAAGMAHLATFAAIAELPEPGVPPWRWLAAAVGVLVLSYPLRWLAHRARQGDLAVLCFTAAGAAGVLQLVLIALLAELGTGAAILGGLLAIQGAVLARANDPAPAVLALALAVVEALLALGLAPGALTLAAALVVIAAVPAAAAVLHAGEARRRALTSRRSHEPEPPRKGELARRLRFATRLSLVAVGAAIVTMAAFSRAARASRSAAASSYAPDPVQDEGRATELDPTGSALDSFEPHIGFGGADGRASNDPVAWVRLRQHDSGEVVRDGRALWLRTLSLDTFTADGLRQPDLADVRLVLDADDGARDGWVELAEPGAEPLLELQLHQRPLRSAGARGDVVLHGQPALAVELPRVRHHPDRATLTGEDHIEWFAYRVLSTPGGLTARRRVDAGVPVRAAHGESRYVLLPPPSPALERVKREALSIVRGATDDRERVGRVLDHFRSGFDYSLEGTGFVGLDSVVAFLDRREGYCTAYATAAVLLLRTLGLPARSAIGYLVTEWDPDEAAYMVRGRHAHAWIEVHFLGRGWVAFDPTPSDRRDRALARLVEESGEPEGLGRWSARLAGDVRDLALGRAAQPGEVLETFVAGPEALLASARRSPVAAALAVLGLVLATMLKLSRRRLRRGPLGIPLPLRTRAESFWDRVVIALEDRGFQRRASQTPREFARSVVTAGGPGYSPVMEVAELLYRSRWGGSQPDRAERALVAGFLRELRG